MKEIMIDGIKYVPETTKEKTVYTGETTKEKTVYTGETTKEKTVYTGETNIPNMIDDIVSFIKNQWQQNKQLQERIDFLTKYSKDASDMIVKDEQTINNLEQENKSLKDKEDKLRAYIQAHSQLTMMCGDAIAAAVGYASMSQLNCSTEEILQILNEGKEGKTQDTSKGN